jgi:hypothetical protein
MVQEVAVNGKIETRFTPDFAETEVRLNDGSRMRICTCDECKQKINAKQMPEIMAKVQKGWQMEVEKLDWTQEKKQKHLDKYNELKIDEVAK